VNFNLVTYAFSSYAPAIYIPFNNIICYPVLLYKSRMKEKKPTNCLSAFTRTHKSKEQQNKICRLNCSIKIAKLSLANFFNLFYFLRLRFLLLLLLVCMCTLFFIINNFNYLIVVISFENIYITNLIDVYLLAGVLFSSYYFLIFSSILVMGFLLFCYFSYFFFCYLNIENPCDTLTCNTHSTLFVCFFYLRWCFFFF